VIASGSFQTVVMAECEEMAWDVAIRCDVWEQLPWDVDNVQIFPKCPVESDVSHTPR
jgi:hypothetical protein